MPAKKKSGEKPFTLALNTKGNKKLTINKFNDVLYVHFNSYVRDGSSCTLTYEEFQYAVSVAGLIGQWAIALEQNSDDPQNIQQNNNFSINPQIAGGGGNMPPAVPVNSVAPYPGNQVMQGAMAYPGQQWVNQPPLPPGPPQPPPPPGAQPTVAQAGASGGQNATPGSGAVNPQQAAANWNNFVMPAQAPNAQVYSSLQDYWQQQNY